MDATTSFKPFAYDSPGARQAAHRYVLFRGRLDELATRPAGRPGRLIVTPNLDHLRLLSRSRALRRAYSLADVVLNDSRAIDRAFVRGRAFVLTGADLAPELLKRLQPGARVYTIGCTPAVETAMRDAYPQLDLRFHNPSMGYIRKRSERRRIVSAVLAADPDCVFVTTGAPQSEIFAAQLKRSGCDADMLCCGSGLLFLAGATLRAPVWLQRLGGEWLWRFLREPRTRARYVRDALFALGAIPSFLQLRRTGWAPFAGYELGWSER